MWLRIDSSVVTRLYITWIPEPKQSPPTEKKDKTLHICVYFCLQSLETKSRNHITHAHCSTHLDRPSLLLVSPQTYYQGGNQLQEDNTGHILLFQSPPKLSPSLTNVSKPNKEQEGKTSSGKYQANSLIKVCSS